MTQPSKLLDHLRERIRCKRQSIRSDASYVQWIKPCMLFNDEVQRISYRRGAMNGDGRRAKRRSLH